MTVIIPSLCIGGYRSFGSTQRAPILSKLNVFIGANNSGKSNVLRFLDRIYPQLQSLNGAVNFDRYERPSGISATFRYGYAVDLRMVNREHQAFRQAFAHLQPNYQYREQALGDLLRVVQAKAANDQTPDFAWFEFDDQGTLSTTGWEAAFSTLDRESLGRVARLAGFTSIGTDFLPHVLRKLGVPVRSIEPIFIPAVRWIQSGTEAPANARRVFDGRGLIDDLDKLSRPDADAYAEREKFDKIERFVQIVTSNPSAWLEIPSSKSTITVHIGNRPLPLESLGTGIHEVVILAAACTLFHRRVICLEEPELHLNPILLRRLVRYLLDETDNQYFMSTHAAALMDTDEAQVYHVSLQDAESRLAYAKTGNARSNVCAELGYHPSDLMQCNCLIWVEGPSDRLYLKFWLAKHAPALREGIDYSIMFYGGHLRAHLTAEDIDNAELSSLDDFISLRRMNRRMVMVIDSDKDADGTELNETKKRLIGEFSKAPGIAWVTKGREIENYLSTEVLQNAIDAVHEGEGLKRLNGPYAKLPKKKGGKDSVNKVAIARYVISREDSFDASVLDLRERLNQLVAFIEESNPRVTAPAGSPG
jgi:predicted ATPase